VLESANVLSVKGGLVMLSVYCGTSLCCWKITKVRMLQRKKKKFLTYVILGEVLCIH